MRNKRSGEDYTFKTAFDIQTKLTCDSKRSSTRRRADGISSAALDELEIHVARD